MRRLEHKAQLLLQKKNALAQEQEMRELDECTLTPQIHDAPAYVKRIVKSLAMAKPAKEALQAQQAKEGKLDWR